MDSMKHYSTYQSQFIEMFGTLGNPKGKIESLGTLCNIQRGGSPRPISEYITDQSDGLNWIKIGDTDDSMYITKTEEKIKPSGLRKTRQVYAGDLLLSNSMSFGRPYILKIDGCIHDGWLVLHINDATKLSPIYLCSYLSQQGTYSEMAKLAAGGVVQNLNSNIIKQLAVIVPNMEEQTKYIQILEQADKSKFSNLKSQFIEMFGDPMTNSKEWPEYGKINQYAQVILGTTPNSKEASYWDGNFKWITPAEMIDESYYIYDTERHITEEGVKSASLTLLPYRSVLFSTRAPIGKVGLAGSPMYCNQGFKNFICGEKLNPVYLYYSLIYKRDYLISLGTGTTFKELSKKTVEGLNMAVPPLHLQDQFESIYDQADKSKLELLQRMESINYIN